MLVARFFFGLVDLDSPQSSAEVSFRGKKYCTKKVKKFNLMNDRDDKNGVYSFLSSWANEILGIGICPLLTLTSVFWESPSHTHTYTPCRLIALQENYLTRFLKRSPQSLLSWSCSLAGCAIQKVFKLNLSFRLCYGFGMGPSLTLQVGIALSVFY